MLSTIANFSINFLLRVTSFSSGWSRNVFLAKRILYSSDGSSQNCIVKGQMLRCRYDRCINFIGSLFTGCFVMYSFWWRSKDSRIIYARNIRILEYSNGSSIRMDECTFVPDRTGSRCEEYFAKILSLKVRCVDCLRMVVTISRISEVL